MSAGTAPKGEARPPRKATTSSRAAGQITDKISKKMWFGLALKPVHALAALAGALALIGVVLLNRPRTPAAITTVPAALPSIATLPTTSPLPDSVPSPPSNSAEKVTEPPTKPASGKSKPQKQRPSETKDPSEASASAGKQKKKADGISPPPSFFDRRAADHTASPAQPKVKRALIREL